MNLKQYRFVTEYLKWGDAAHAYKLAYNSSKMSYQTLAACASRLLKNPEVVAAIEESEARIRSEAEAEVRQQLTGELLTVQRKREILARIAEGNIYIEQQFKGKDCNTCTQLVKPTINQMLKAIDLDSKLAGDYPTAKQIPIVHSLPPAGNTTKEIGRAVTHITQAELHKILAVKMSE